MLCYTTVVQSPSCVQLLGTPWTAARQASLSPTISRSLSKFMFIAVVVPSSHLILWHAHRYTCTCTYACTASRKLYGVCPLKGRAEACSPLELCWAPMARLLAWRGGRVPPWELGTSTAPGPATLPPAPHPIPPDPQQLTSFLRRQSLVSMGRRRIAPASFSFYEDWVLLFTTVGLQRCVSFRCIAEWCSYACTPVHSFFRFFAHPRLL